MSAFAHVDNLQVVQHPRQDVQVVDHLQKGVLPLQVRAVDFLDPFGAVFRRQELAGVKRIHVEGLGMGAVAHDEVPGQADAVDRQTGAAAHVDIDDGEGNRDADLALQHLVQKAVARVVVVPAVAAQAVFLEETGIEAGNDAMRLELHAQAARNRFRHAVEALQAVIDIQIGIRFQGDEKRAFGQAHVCRRPLDVGRKAAPCL